MVLQADSGLTAGTARRTSSRVASKGTAAPRQGDPSARSTRSHSRLSNAAGDLAKVTHCLHLRQMLCLVSASYCSRAYTYLGLAGEGRASACALPALCHSLVQQFQLHCCCLSHINLLLLSAELHLAQGLTCLHFGALYTH